jgi:mannose-6-phosphate isomerase
MAPVPLTFEPLLKYRVWGGRRLASLGKPLGAHDVIGESWELADLPESIEGGRSVIANGPWRGLTLHEALRLHLKDIMGRRSLTLDGGFPLLLKFLDARENLSVQVHPDDAYVSRHPGSHLKSEAWYIVAAEAGAVIYKGLREGVDRQKFLDHVKSASVPDVLQAVPAIPGECHYLPSGTCHALGAGVLVAEVQTPSDTTFRVYDWGRVGRELHLQQALECISFDDPPAHRRIPAPITTAEFRTSELCRTNYFTIERLEILRPATLPISNSGEPVVWMFLHGDGAIQSPGADDVPLSPGTTLLLPANIREAHARFQGPSTLLRITLPDTMQGKIA